MPLLRDGEPLITPRDIPALRPDLVDVTSVFNPGALRWRDREFLLLRVQTRGRTTASSRARPKSTRLASTWTMAVRIRLAPPVPNATTLPSGNDAMVGDIMVESRLGVGSCFRLEFPAVKPVPASHDTLAGRVG